MSQTLIVIHSLKDWTPYYPSEQVIAFSEYMNGKHLRTAPRTRIINLCRTKVTIAHCWQRLAVITSYRQCEP